MKTLKRLTLISALAVASVTSFTAAGQQSDPQTVNNRSYTDDDGNRMSPWWGLLGLIGLFGLMRKNDPVHLETDTRAPR